MENVYCGDKDDAPTESLRCKETITTAGGARHVRCEILWNGRPLPRASTSPTSERSNPSDTHTNIDKNHSKEGHEERQRKASLNSNRTSLPQSSCGDSDPITFDQTSAERKQRYNRVCHEQTSTW